MWIGNFRGSGDIVRLAGFIVGTAAGLGSWQAMGRRSNLAALVVIVATSSLLASMPTAVDQTSQLIRLYGGMSSAEAARHAAGDISGASPTVFDRLTAAIPRDDTYLLHGDVPFETWSRYWLLPRVAVSNRRQADWIIFHGARPVGERHLTRIDANTWLEKVGR